MDVIQSLEAIHRPARPAVVTVGNFDGVHLGHRALVRTVQERARAISGVGTAVTFDPHPQALLHPDRAPVKITSMTERIEILGELGLDRLIVIPFTVDFSEIEADSFVRDWLVDRIGASEIYVGSNFGFGRGKRGNFELISRIARELELHASILDLVTDDGVTISSTRIRALLAAADLGRAREELGRPYGLRGKVVAGEGRGRTIGVPTANIAGDKPLLLPHGVYAARVAVLGRWWSAALNFGTRPTFDGARASVEAHLLDFPGGDLRGHAIRVQFWQKLRDEQRFDGVAQLTEQVARDVAAAREVLSNAAFHG